MRLLLASSRPALAGELRAFAAPGARVAVVVNAQDGAGRRARRAALAEEQNQLAGAGCVASELDLRDFHRRRPERLAAALGSIDVVWVTGGNVFILREAMRAAGLDRELRARAADTRLAYVGWSAGACVCGPTLRGLELVDTLPDGLAPTWDGLGLVEHAVVPHLGSPPPLGPEIDRVVAFWRASATPYRALRDGETIAV